VKIARDMFHTPMSAPTARRTKIALVIDASAPCPGFWTSSHLWPFFRAMSAATMQHSTSATWMGPSSASKPNRESEAAMSTARVASGVIASAREGFTRGRLTCRRVGVGHFRLLDQRPPGGTSRSVPHARPGTQTECNLQASGAAIPA
jgi:hypothetical protein